MRVSCQDLGWNLIEEDVLTHTHLFQGINSHSSVVFVDGLVKHKSRQKL